MSHQSIFMKYLLLSFLFILSCSSGKESESPFSYPPEWEKHQAVWIDFHEDKIAVVPDSRARFEVIEALHRFVPVKVLIDGEGTREHLDTLISNAGLDTSKIEIIHHPEPNLAMRDAGPIFLSNGHELKMAHFKWSGYGGVYDGDLGRGQIPVDLANRFGWEVRESEYSAEGGGLEVNENVILSFKHHGLSRNPGKTLEEIEAAYLKQYYKEKMIWIEHPLLLEKSGNKIENYYGQGADQHIDAYMRFINDSTLLVPVIDESERYNSPIQEHDYESIQKNLSQIKKETNANGRPFRIVEIPMPDISLYTFQTKAEEYMVEGFPEMELGEEVVFVPIMGYSNFLITNGAVLVAEYWSEGLPEKEKKKDQRMKDILKLYFPNREIIGIKNAILLNWNGGGIHCQTQQEPFVQ